MANQLRAPFENGCLAKLPQWGVLSRVSNNGGHGTVIESQTFVHVAEHIHGYGKSHLELLQGDTARPILYISGTHPIHGGPRAMLWCFADEISLFEGNIPKNQNSYDVHRRKILGDYELSKLQEIVSADFYVSRWAKVAPPADLTDRLLCEAVAANLKTALRDDWQPFFNTLGESPYKDIRFNVPTFTALTIAAQSIDAQSIAFDLETDGVTIREIGVADITGSKALFDTHTNTSTLDAAVKILAKSFKEKKFIVGHNAAQWDIPILQKLRPDIFKAHLVVWDTLLISCLMSPWNRSHALGGNHRAEDDAKDCFNLFRQQIEAIDPVTREALLTTPPSSTIELLQRIGASLETTPLNPPKFPEWFKKISSHASSCDIAFLPRPAIRELYWDKEVTPIEFNGTSPVCLDASLFSAISDTSNLGNVVVQSIVQRAKHSGISVITDMVPPVLRYLPDMDKILNRCLAVVPPKAGLMVAAYPTLCDDFKTFYKSRQPLFILTSPNGLIFNAESKANDLQQALPRPTAPCLYRSTNEPQSWRWYDPIPSTDTNGRCWQPFSTWTPSGKIVEVDRPQFNYSVPDVGNLAIHHPTSAQQRDYWGDVVERFNRTSIWCKQEWKDCVPMLVLVSSAGVKLLTHVESALISLGRVELPQDRSRLERLRRVVGKTDLCIVDVVTSLDDWFAAASILGIQLIPVMEALPLHEWYALLPAKSEEAEPDETDTNTELDDESEGDDSVNGPEDVVADDAQESVQAEITKPTTEKLLFTPVPNAQIIMTVIGARDGTQLLNLIDEWLSVYGLSDKSPVVLLDPRISAIKHKRIKPFKLQIAQTDRKALEGILNPIQPHVPREMPETTTEALKCYLQKHWFSIGDKGQKIPFTGFKDQQNPVIKAIAPYDADVLVTLPTGGGKSVLFQVPALYRGEKTRRLSLVISPLRALMQDQVNNLHKLGFHESVDYLSADRPWHETEAVFQGVLDNRICLLYVAPERFRSRRFLDLLDRRHQSDGAFEFIIIDEAHCVAQWGYEFRPDYFNAMEVLRERYRKSCQDGLPLTPFLLFSATVTARTRDDLKRIIGSSDDLKLRVVPHDYFNPIREHIQIKTAPVQGKIGGSKAADWHMQPRIDAISAEIKVALKNRASSGGEKSAVIVFVSRRAHAEELAFLLGKEFLGQVEYFHAGLDADRRNEIYEYYKAGNLDILVATKAFGMGMDIGFIHWAIHLSPPSYMEDYFQEVGRIGRDIGSMKAAGLDTLTATLLHSVDDFSGNSSAIQRSRINYPQLDEFLKQIIAETKLIGTAQIAIIPDAGFGTYVKASHRRSATTSVRVMLHWLEKMQRVELLQMLPGLLKIRIINQKELALLAKGSELQANVARCILTMSQPLPDNHRTNTDTDHQPGFLERILDGISSFFGVLFDATPAVPIAAANPAPPTPQGQEGLVDLAAISRAISAQMFDVLTTLASLHRQGAIQIIRSLHFGRGATHSKLTPQQIGMLFDALQNSVDSVAKAIAGKGEVEITWELIGANFVFNDAAGNSIDLKMPFEKSVAYLLRVAGARTHKKMVGVGDGARMALFATLNENRNLNAPAHIINLSKLIINQLGDVRVGNGALELQELLQIVNDASATYQRKYRERELKQSLGLLASLWLVNCSEPFVPMSYVLEAAQPDKPFQKDNYPDEFAELEEVNRLAELRGHAMELFVALPEEAREKFVEGYFAKVIASDMDNYLREQVRSVLNTNQAEWVATMLAKIQAEGIKELFDKYRSLNAPSPNQWKAISHPFNRHLLVNAGPGSGKTAVLVARVAHLIHEQKLRPEEIMVLAFNRAVVFEIRSRIRELFQKLGYGAYVRSLRVSTFHALATRHVGHDANGFQVFTAKLADDNFARTVANGVRAILVDEFQDADRDIFTVIQRLQAVSNASIMAIGDDDQDILRWKRIKGGLMPPETEGWHYFEKFAGSFRLDQGDQLALTVNFRSDTQIVDRTQKILNNFFIQAFNPQLQARLKLQIPLAARHAADVGNYERLGQDGDLQTCGIVINRAVEILLENGVQTGQESIAILCRTNSEVVELYQRLHPLLPALRIQQKSADLRLEQLRHIACLLDLCKSIIGKDGDQPLSKARNPIHADFQRLNIPEARNPGVCQIRPEDILDLVETESSYARLSDVQDFAESTKIDEFFCMLDKGSESKAKPAVVSTIHKVKGLQFDKVVVVPSNTSFPSGRDNALGDAAAEEARLLYVALTRAKHEIVYGRGPREMAWWEGKQINQNAIAITQALNGTLDKEVDIGWAARENNFAVGAQAYIKEYVAVGDDIQVDGPWLYHISPTQGRRQIGALKKPLKGDGNSKLKVSAVVRFEQALNPAQPQLFNGLMPEVQKQGWSYVVLVAGTL